MKWQEQLKGDSLSWLLKRNEPGVGYMARRDLLGLPPDDAELLAAQAEAHERGPIAAVLDEMEADGYWVKPGPGYLPKYRSTVWAIILLSQLGGRIDQDTRIAKACSYLLETALTENGQFTSTGAPSGTVDCLQGNLCYALVDLGCNSSRLELAYEWMARSVTGEDIAPNTERKAPVRYYAGQCGPGFACGANNKLPCAWGAAKVMLAFARLPAERRTPLIEQAIERGVEFLFSVDPATAEYPCGWNAKPSRNWWKFGFPVFYVTDLLQIVEALVRLGYGGDPRLENALAIILEKQDGDGRWAMEYDYSGKTWVDFGAIKQPNSWVTLRALRILKQLDYC